MRIKQASLRFLSAAGVFVAGGLAFGGVHLSCGSVESACAQSCPGDAKIAALEAKVAALETGAATLATGVDTNAASITALSTRVDGLVLAPGTLAMHGGDAVPSGWVLCDGAAVSRSTYPALFTALGTTYGAGDGSTTFNVPDLRGRAGVGVGTGPGLSTYALGQSSGSESHTLTVAQVPAHSHPLMLRAAGSGPNEGAWNLNWNTVGAFGSQSAIPALHGNGSQNFMTIENAGGGQAFDKRQPTLALHYIIKV